MSPPTSPETGATEPSWRREKSTTEDTTVRLTGRPFVPCGFAAYSVAPIDTTDAEEAFAKTEKDAGSVIDVLFAVMLRPAMSDAGRDCATSVMLPEVMLALTPNVVVAELANDTDSCSATAVTLVVRFIAASA